MCSVVQELCAQLDETCDVNVVMRRWTAIIVKVLGATDMHAFLALLGIEARSSCAVNSSGYRNFCCMEMLRYVTRAFF